MLHKKVCGMIATIREKYASANNRLLALLYFLSLVHEIGFAKLLMGQVLWEIFSQMVRKPRGV